MKEIMTTYNLFGVFIKEKRKQNNISLRELAKKTKITPTYLLYIEEGKKPPPSDLILLRMADALMLDNEAKSFFFDLALKIKQINNKNIILPADISQYLNKTDSARMVIRKANNLGYSNEFWNKILNIIDE